MCRKKIVFTTLLAELWVTNLLSISTLANREKKWKTLHIPYKYIYRCFRQIYRTINNTSFFLYFQKMFENLVAENFTTEHFCWMSNEIRCSLEQCEYIWLFFFFGSHLSTCTIYIAHIQMDLINHGKLLRFFLCRSQGPSFPDQFKKC